MITYHNRSHIQALMDLYPNLNLQREKFVGVSGMPSFLPVFDLINVTNTNSLFSRYFLPFIFPFLFRI